MADKKDNKVTLVLSDDKKSFVPTKLPLSIMRSIKEGISQTLNPFASADPRIKYSVGPELMDNPNVELYQKDGKFYAEASVKVLQNYNKSWSPGGISGAAAKAQAEGVKARNEEIQGALATDTGQKVKITKEEILGTAIAVPKETKVNPTDYIQSGYINSQGEVVTDANGNASFSYPLPDPTGTGTNVAQPAALLPGGMGYFYVKPIIDAAKEFEKTYSYKAQTGGPSISDLKKELWLNRYMTDDAYRQSVRPGLENRFDPATTSAVENMLNGVSVANKKLLEQGNMELIGWKDFLQQTYQQTIITGEQVNIPSDKRTDEILKQVFRAYKNMDPTDEEFNNFRLKVAEAAKASPVTSYEEKNPITGVTTQITKSGFTEDDVASLAEEMTRGTPERRAYYGLQQFGEAFNNVIRKSSNERANTLTEVLQ